MPTWKDVLHEVDPLLAVHGFRQAQKKALRFCLVSHLPTRSGMAIE
jgi:hypothetical protein